MVGVKEVFAQSSQRVGSRSHSLTIRRDGGERGEGEREGEGEGEERETRANPQASVPSGWIASTREGSVV
jgi:hypothetical protein